MKSNIILFVCHILLATFAYSSSILGITNKQPSSNQLHTNGRSASDNCSAIPTTCPVCKDDIGWGIVPFPTICDYANIIAADIVYPNGSKPLYKFHITNVLKSTGIVPPGGPQYDVITMINCILDCPQVWFASMMLFIKPGAFQDGCVIFDDRVLVITYNSGAVDHVVRLLKEHKCYK